MFYSLNLFDLDRVHGVCEMIRSPTKALVSHRARTKSWTAHTQCVQKTHYVFIRVSRMYAYVKMPNLKITNQFKVNKILNKYILRLDG